MILKALIVNCRSQHSGIMLLNFQKEFQVDPQAKVAMSATFSQAYK